MHFFERFIPSSLQLTPKVNSVLSTSRARSVCLAVDVHNGIGVVLKQHSASGVLARLRSWFPEREFFMRSQGQIRFLTITTRMQMTAAGIVAAILLGWAGSMGAMAFSQHQASSELASLLDREAKVATAEDRVSHYRENLAETTADLKKRQDFIESLLPMLPEDLVAEAAAENVSDSSDESAELISLIRSSIPEAAGLARIEARQLAFVERLTCYADRRSLRAEAAIRKLGLEPRVVVRSGDRAAMGGPLEKMVSESDGSLDQRFARLGASLARMSALERGLDGIPQVMPADINAISSGFGYRSDPFNGSAAMHSGLDFRRPTGAPIHAAAAGRVSFAGVKSGYGNVVEISHGSGMITRYAHMSRFNATVGQEVAAGERIGAIGSTGRSTGPHLHFEVRINGRAVNPRPFLETAPDVLEEARAEFTPSVGKTNG